MTKIPIHLGWRLGEEDWNPEKAADLHPSESIRVRGVGFLVTVLLLVSSRGLLRVRWVLPWVVA